ncbi:MAG: DCC1-like thiol-disulfide oxidoreductase family protein [Bdellovibrionota bacterium]
MNILFFDGHCNLCNGLVDWLLRKDKNGKIKFASLQGETAKKTLSSNHLNSIHDPETVLYFQHGIIYERSTAILKCLQDIGGIWKLVAIFFLIPRSLRDLTYRLIATNRYRIFGRRETCRIPTPQEAARLLP